jgi:uncharacterized membrane protein YfcA
MILTALFFLVALVYSSVGFGGGSSYLALLHWQGVAPALLPALGLSCNLIVSGQGFAQFAHAGHFPWRRSLPFLALSVPASYLGGLFPVRESTFFLLLAASLTAAGTLLLLPARDVDRPPGRLAPRLTALGGPLIGAALGFLSGIVGIGGGIFLAPILHLARWAPAQQVAALAAGFIFVNSAAGLTGQLQKHAATTEALAPYWPLPVAVLAGGLIGARCGCSVLAARRVRQITGSIILIVAGNLWTKFLP